MAVDEAGLERAATALEPGDAEWDANMRRLAARIEQLRLGGMKRLSLGGIDVPLPDPAVDLQKWVQDFFESTGERRAQLPLVPTAQDAEPAALGTVAGPPPPAPRLRAPQPPAPRGSAAGEAAGAAEPMEVEPPPAPAPTQAPTPLLVPPSALPSLSLSQLVQELESVVRAVPLDESRAERLLDSLEGLKLTEQEMQDSGAPPPPPPPPRTCRPPPLAYPPTLHHTSRTGACRMVNRLRKKNTTLKPRADELYRRWTGTGAD